MYGDPFIWGKVRSCVLWVLPIQTPFRRSEALLEPNKSHQQPQVLFLHLTSSLDISMASVWSLKNPSITPTWLFSSRTLHSVCICWGFHPCDWEFDAHSEFIDEQMDVPWQDRHQLRFSGLLGMPPMSWMSPSKPSHPLCAAQAHSDGCVHP